CSQNRLWIALCVLGVCSLCFASLSSVLRQGLMEVSSLSLGCYNSFRDSEVTIRLLRPQGYMLKY
ncbi:hypothetical protein Nmel_006106, partial [Mimus melanotis]